MREERGGGEGRKIVMRVWTESEFSGLKKPPKI